MKKERLWIGWILVMAGIAYGLSWVGYVRFRSELIDLGWSKSQVGWGTNTVLYARIIAPFLAAACARWLGVTRAVMLGLILACACLISPFLMEMQVPFLISRILFGIGGMAVFTLMGPVILERFPREEWPLWNALTFFSAQAGISLSLMSSKAIAEGIEMEGTLLVFAGLSLLAAVFWGLKVKEESSSVESVPRADVGFVEILRIRKTLCLTLVVSAALAIGFHFKGFSRIGLRGGSPSNGWSGLTRDLINPVGLVAVLAGAYLVKWTGKKKIWIGLSGVLLLVSGLLAELPQNGFTVFLRFVLFGIGSYLWVAPLLTMMMEMTGPEGRRMSSGALAMLTSVVYGVSSIFTSPLVDFNMFSFMRVTGSLVPGFVLYGVLACVVVVGGLLL